MNIERPIVFFDLETTGTDIAKDRIVQIGAIKIAPNGDKEVKVMVKKYLDRLYDITDQDRKYNKWKEVKNEY